MADLSRSFQRALGEFGAPKGGEAAPAEMLQAYQGRLPESLLQFWEQYGFGMWLDGYFQFCNPKEYQPLLSLIFGKDSDFLANQSHLIGFSSFGKLLVWNEVLYDVDVDLVNLEVTCSKFFNPEKRMNPETAIASAILGVEGDSYDEGDKNGDLLFRRARSKLGPLKWGEMYGFKLAASLGGERTLDNLGIVQAYEHMAILAQTGRLRLMDYSRLPVRYVRDIG